MSFAPYEAYARERLVGSPLRNLSMRYTLFETSDYFTVRDNTKEIIVIAIHKTLTNSKVLAESYAANYNKESEESFMKDRLHE